MSAGKGSVRSKIDSFFKGGKSTVISAKKNTVGDLEDPFDIYNHTKQFYKSTEAAKDYDKQVEVGERKIRGDPLMMVNELDELVYGGQKVTR